MLTTKQKAQVRIEELRDLREEVLDNLMLLNRESRDESFMERIALLDSIGTEITRQRLIISALS